MSTSHTPALNRTLLDEISRADGWFRAKKSRPIWVKVLEADQHMETLEGLEHAKRGECLCRGEHGDQWPQSCKSVNDKYVATEEWDDGWRKYVPRPNAEGVLAAQLDHEFTIESPWGILYGKAGDYVVKNYSDRDHAYPSDVWLVDQNLFHATYEPSAPK